MGALLAGCEASPAGEPPFELGALEIGTAGMDTVLLARWQTATPRADHLTVTFGEESIDIVEPEPVTEHAVPLIGVPPNEEAVVQLFAAGARVAEGTGTTGSLPAWVPAFGWSANAPDQTEGGLTLVSIASGGGERGGALILDGAGRVVWSYPPEDAGIDLMYRVRLSLDGKAVLANLLAPNAAASGPIYRIALADASLDIVGITGGHVDFVEPVPGVYASLGWDIREIDGRRILGDTLVERAADGTERVVWNVWDHFAPDLSVTWPRMYIADDGVEDWSHINGLSYAVGEDAYYATMTFNHGVARIDRSSGSLSWVLSPHESDFALDDPGQLAYPHSAERLPDGGLLVFNRADSGEPGVPAFVSEFALEEAAGVATTRWRYEDPAGVRVAYLGSAQRLAGGNTVISWASAGQLDEVTPEGEVAWRVTASIGEAFGFATRYPGVSW